MAKAKNYWLFKSDPDSFGIDHLEAAPNQTTNWDGVRNFQARNFLRDGCQVGDLVLFYHSQVDPPTVMGIAEVVKAAYPDPSQFDPQSKYFDEKSKEESPQWVMVDIQLKQRFKRPVTLAELRTRPELAKMEVLRKGSRLSIQSVTADEFKTVLGLAKSG